MSSPSKCHLSVLLAPKGSVAAIFRRGPSKWVQLIKWNTLKDTFEFGQWFNGTIYTERCSISPDGSKLVYFCSKFNQRTLKDSEYTFAWTAVSKLPYFTAIALWPSDGSTWYGGGVFVDDRSIYLHLAPEKTEAHPDHRPPGQLKVKVFQEQDYDFIQERMASIGWYKSEGEPWYWQKDRPAGKYILRYQEKSEISEGDLWGELEFVVHYKEDLASNLEFFSTSAGADAGKETRSQNIACAYFTVRTASNRSSLAVKSDRWVEWDSKGHLIFSDGGKLLRARVDRHGIQ
ncbi:MAG: hypothetical protein K8F91_06465, partial [Candidatus Obscuribacterales bacterium]|nr:hypothetical protein [Candidatus Obscuribacterales bacterium]